MERNIDVGVRSASYGLGAGYRSSGSVYGPRWRARDYIVMPTITSLWWGAAWVKVTIDKPNYVEKRKQSSQDREKEGHKSFSVLSFSWHGGIQEYLLRAAQR